MNNDYAKSMCYSRTSTAFTLIELIIVIALMAFLYMVAIPQINVQTGSEATTKMNRLLGDFRNAYDLAVLSGKNYRLVFEFVSGDYWLEETDRKDFYLGDEKVGHDLTAEEEKEEEEIFKAEFAEFEELAGEAYVDPESDEEIPPVSAVLKAKDKLKPIKWTKVTSLEWENRSLGPYLIIQDIQAEHHGNKQTLEDLGETARAVIHVFGHGYLERAVLHIAYKKGDMSIDEDQLPYTVITHPHSGLATYKSGYEEVDVHKIDEIR